MATVHVESVRARSRVLRGERKLGGAGKRGQASAVGGGVCVLPGDEHEQGKELAATYK